ncbi:DUF3549 family protein [Catenovulum sp. SM1970]|uniref:DUF3549 family protein n=1 Tax=Marinifaba aquimaris TaxID=2741323 RepID=UPI00157296F8|nr:DUF3549 family protein [Marinifaba aquimaris]NTS77750.1 DUF3549 family protein [Marinifaba aquimaris]
MSQPEHINTIYEMLAISDCEYKVFDIGRRVQEIDNQSFEQFEQAQLAYPYPIQQSARFALIYWTKENKHNPFIWFLNLALDEEGLLNLGTRNHFLSIITEALGQQFAQVDENGEQQSLPDNPYIKAPDEKKLAILNAKLKRFFVQPMSKAYQDCVQFFEQPNDQDWRQLTVQGLADFCAQLDNPSNRQKLEACYFDLPHQLQSELAAIIEHNSISRALMRRLVKKAATILATPRDIDDVDAFNRQSTELITCLRTLSSCAADSEVRDFISALFKHEFGLSPDVLSVLTARLWLAFDDEDMLLLLLEHIASHPQHYVFNALFADIVAIPCLRTRVFPLLRDANKLPKTRIALTKMVQADHATH